MKVTKKILVIDPFVKQPVNNCFNRLVDLFAAKLYLFQPALFPMLIYNIPVVDAYIVLGSASHVSENLPWHRSLADFLINELKAGKPVLGLCFGHQLLAHQFGADVDFLDPSEQKILGSRVIQWKGRDFELGVTHRQAVQKLSSTLIAIDTANAFGFDFIQHQTLPFIGCQAHPEASEQFLSIDCAIEDYAKRQKILHDSSLFLKQWYEHYVEK